MRGLYSLAGELERNASRKAKTHVGSPLAREQYGIGDQDALADVGLTRLLLDTRGWTCILAVAIRVQPNNRLVCAEGEK